MTDQMLVTYFLVHDSSVVEMFKRSDDSMYRVTMRLGIKTQEAVVGFVTFPEKKDEGN